MKHEIRTVEELQKYLQGVKDRADHHGRNVNQIVVMLGGAIVTYKDPWTPVTVMEQQGDLKNVMWLSIGGQQYAFSFNHKNANVEMREGTTQGTTLHSFNNATPLQDIVDAFEGLVTAKCHKKNDLTAA